MLTKLTCLIKFFILHVSRNGTYIIFKSSQKILLLYTSEISVFTDSLCIFAILVIIVLKFSTLNVQKYFYDNILLNFETILDIFAPTFFNFMLVIWQFNIFFSPMFYTVIFKMFLTLILCNLVVLIFNMYVKLICIV